MVAGWELLHEPPAVQLDPTHIFVADPDVNVRRLKLVFLVFTTNWNCPSLATVGIQFSGA
jgi:hypothetical protein